MQKVVLTLGSDPEFMLENKSGEIVSAIEVLKRGKHDPIPLSNGEFFYYDNVNLETRVKPSNTCEGYVESVRSSLQGIADFLGKDFMLKAQASHNFDPKYLTHPDSVAFGCSEEYCAYALSVVTAPEAPATFRSAGGHIHIGRNDFESFEDIDGIVLLDPWSKVNAVKMMDLFVGTSIAILDNDPTSVARKALYGNAGRHRAPAYGFEYRTPGNYWLNSPELVALIFDLTQHAVSFVLNDTHEEILGKVNQEKLIEAVNTNNKDMSANILEEVGLPDSLKARLFTLAAKNFNNIYGAWGLAA